MAEGLEPGLYPALVIPAQVRAWAQEHLKSEIIAIEPVGGGRTDTISAVYLRRGEPVVLRYVSIERWGEIGRQHVSCEALGCRLMEGSSLPVPHLIASDPDGSRAGDYANLTTWLPGRVRLGPLSLDAIDELAKIAVIIGRARTNSGLQMILRCRAGARGRSCGDELSISSIKVRRRPIRDSCTVTFIPETSCGKAIESPV